MKAKYVSVSEEYGIHFSITLEKLIISHKKLQEVCTDLEKTNDEYKTELSNLRV